MDLVLVDGPNLFNTIGRHLEAADKAEEIEPSEEDSIRSYFLRWFDVNRLVAMSFAGTTAQHDGAKLGTVIFHSNKPLGGSRRFRINQEQISDFWGRQAANRNTSAMLVDIPGEQLERFVFECKAEGCHEKNEVTTSGEKGVDSSMISYMFESAARWESLCIFSRDVDFVPAVWALRRQGKQVYAAGSDDDARSALGRAVQHVFPLALGHAVADLAAFRFLRKGGVLDCIIQEAVKEGERWPKVLVDERRVTVMVHPHMKVGLAEAQAASKAYATMQLSTVLTADDNSHAQFWVPAAGDVTRKAREDAPLWAALEIRQFDGIWRAVERQADAPNS